MLLRNYEAHTIGTFSEFVVANNHLIRPIRNGFFGLIVWSSVEESHLDTLCRQRADNKQKCCENCAKSLHLFSGQLFR